MAFLNDRLTIATGLRAAAFAIVAAMGTLVLGGCEQSMVTRANEAAAALRDFSLSTTPIPPDQFESAVAVAVVRGGEVGVVFSGGGGKGVMVRRNGNEWSAPIALDTAEGSFGAQIGGKSYDVVMLFRNDAEVEKVISNGSYSVADASANAGPAESRAQDNDNPVRTYMKESGLFAGARVGGVGFVVNKDVNNETYGISRSVDEILGGKVDRPRGTGELYRQLPAPK